MQKLQVNNFLRCCYYCILALKISRTALSEKATKTKLASQCFKHCAEKYARWTEELFFTTCCSTHFNLSGNGVWGKEKKRKRSKNVNLPHVQKSSFRQRNAEDRHWKKPAYRQWSYNNSLLDIQTDMHSQQSSCARQPALCCISSFWNLKLFFLLFIFLKPRRFSFFET